MTALYLELKPLTAEAFTPFGEVIQKRGHTPEVINYGHTRKYANLAEINTSDKQGRTELHIYRSRPLSLPFQIETMEYHPLGSQAFIPLHGRPFLLVVAAPAAQLKVESIQGFITNGEQAVNLHKNVWHHYQISLDQTSDYLVIERGGPGKNTIEQHLDKTLFIDKF